MRSSKFLLLFILWFSSTSVIADADPALGRRVLADSHIPSFNSVLVRTETRPATNKLKESKSGKEEWLDPLAKDYSSNLVTNQNTDDIVTNKKKSSTLTSFLSSIDSSFDLVDFKHLSISSRASALSSSIRSLVALGDRGSTSGEKTMQDKDTRLGAESSTSTTFQQKPADDASSVPQISADPDHESQVTLGLDALVSPIVSNLKSTQSGPLSVYSRHLDKTIDESKSSKSKSSKSKSSKSKGTSTHNLEYECRCEYPGEDIYGDRDATVAPDSSKTAKSKTRSGTRTLSADNGIKEDQKSKGSSKSSEIDSINGYIVVDGYTVLPRTHPACQNVRFVCPGETINGPMWSYQCTALDKNTTQVFSKSSRSSKSSKSNKSNKSGKSEKGKSGSRQSDLKRSESLFTPSFNEHIRDSSKKGKGDAKTKSKSTSKTGADAYLYDTTTAYPNITVFIILLPESKCPPRDCEPTLTPDMDENNPQGPAPTEKSASLDKASETEALDFSFRPVVQGKSSSSVTNSIIKTTSKVQDKRSGKGGFDLALDGYLSEKAYDDNSSKSKSSKSKRDRKSVV